MTTMTNHPQPISKQDQGKSIVRSLAAHRDTYREFGDIPQVRERIAFQMSLDEEEMDNLFNVYLAAEKTRDDITWTGHKPWDDQWERYHQDSVHTLTAELSRVVEGPVVADTLNELFQ